MNYKEGELVYIPSEVSMNKYSSFDEGKYITEHYTTKNPEYLLVVDKKNSKEVGVFFNGDTWFVSEKDVYKSNSTSPKLFLNLGEKNEWFCCFNRIVWREQNSLL